MTTNVTTPSSRRKSSSSSRRSWPRSRIGSSPTTACSSRGRALRFALAGCTGGKFVQEVNAVTLAVEHLHPDVGSVVELGGQDAKIIMFKTDEKTGAKTALASMNDKCASGTGRHHRQVLPQGERTAGARHHAALRRLQAPSRRREVRRVRGDGHRQSHQERHSPRMKSSARSPTAIVMQNLSVLTRGSTLKSRVLLLRRTQHVPAVPPGLLAPAHPRRCGTSAATSTTSRSRSKRWSSFRRTRSTPPRLGAVLYGLHEPAEVGWLKGRRRSPRVHHHGPEGASR